MQFKSKFLAVAALLAAAFVSVAQSQQYPVKPIRAISPFPPGGVTDKVLRPLTLELGKRFEQPVVLEVRPGADTIIGAEACAKSPGDGYTFCMLPIDALVLNPFLFKKLPYDANNDFEPVINVFYVIEALVVHPSLGVDTLAQLIDLAKSRPGVLNYASPASFVTLFMEDYKRTAKIDIRQIPYKGGAPAVTAVIAGEVQVAYFALSNVVGMLKSGRVKALAIDSPVRSPLLPDVLTFRESGYVGGVPLRAWFGIVAPKGTPGAVVTRLNAEIAKIAGTPQFLDPFIHGQGLEPILKTPEDFARQLNEDRKTAERLIRQAGLQAQ